MALSPESVQRLRLDQAAAKARRGALRAFRGVDVADPDWALIADRVAGVLLDAQVSGTDIAAGYLTQVARSEVAPAAGRVGRVGVRTIDEFLEITPRAHGARLARGLSDGEAIMATAAKLATSAGTEPHRLARDIVIDTASTDPRFFGWARVTVGDSCAFCLMLAGRGAVYRSAETAAGKRYHTGCDCIAVALPQQGTHPRSKRGPRAATASQTRAEAAKYRAGAATPERQASIRRQLEVLRVQQAAGKATAWTASRIAELEIEAAA